MKVTATETVVAMSADIILLIVPVFTAMGVYFGMAGGQIGATIAGLSGFALSLVLLAVFEASRKVAQGGRA